ncbi:DBH-like monooxygenase protein 1 homolog [Lineus longissimus]|uniref:DBH-like monooxygenase protein 1 homolog n=1 Tax=Lineus longissimus TaxID=88925 RepID=UPI00315D244C
MIILDDRGKIGSVNTAARYWMDTGHFGHRTDSTMILYQLCGRSSGWIRIVFLILFLTFGLSSGHLMSSRPNTANRARSRISPSEDYIHSVTLSEDTRYTVFWKFDNDTVTFEIHVETLGWVGFGFSPSGGMRGSDVVMGWVKDGIPHLSDRHAAGHALPKRDESQDYELLLGEEKDGLTILKFRRALVTCDEHDSPIEDGTVRLIYAWNDKDPDREDNLNYLYHYGNRGVKSVVLLDYNRVMKKRMAPEESSGFFDTMMDNITIPAEKTVYWCKFFKMPHFGKKHHIIGASTFLLLFNVTLIEPLVESGNDGLLHHIVVYLCNQWETSIKSKAGERCYHNNMPPNVTVCDSVIFGYAVGMRELVFPENAGYPVGRPHDPKFMYLEVHYDNQQMLEGLRDNSGLRFRYTSKLRQYDAGVLEIGHTVWWPPMLIPPKAKEFKVNTYCSSQCTKKFIPEAGINFIAVFLHTHLAGHRIWMKHVRNGTELPEIARDNHYDFNYQQFRLLSKEVTILPGDEIVTTCTYNTKHRKHMTYGGLSTKEEMCFNFVMYYPRIEMSKCLSTVFQWSDVEHYIAKKAVKGEIDYDQYNRVHNVFDYLNQVKWTRKEIHKFQRMIDRSDGYREYCEKEGNGAGPMVSKKYDYLPKVKIINRHKRTTTCRKSNLNGILNARPEMETVRRSGSSSILPKFFTLPMTMILALL